MNIEQVTALLQAGFSAAFIERLAGEAQQPTQAAEQPQQTEQQPTQVSEQPQQTEQQPTPEAEQPKAQDTNTAELKALTGEIKNLISAVQASNIRSMSMGEPQNNAATAASYIESLINGGKKNE